MKIGHKQTRGDHHAAPGTAAFREADRDVVYRLQQVVQDLHARLETVFGCQSCLSNGAHASALARTLRDLGAALNVICDSSIQSAGAEADVLLRLATLSRRERQVMALVVEGIGNKQIAARLGLSQRTVEYHRAGVMRKMAAASVADLVRMAIVGDQRVHPAPR